MDLRTRCVHGARDRNNTTGAVTVPIYQTATFAHTKVGAGTGYDYSRLQNPTREALESTVCALEGGCDALAFSSGMAAMALLMELLAPGDHVLAGADLYGGSVRLLHHVVRQRGVAVDEVFTGDLTLVEAAFRPNTRALFVETPTNPMMQISDLAALATLCHSRDVWLFVDNTFLTPLYQQPLALGADVVLHSGTKYLSGHNDVLAGFLVTGDAKLSETLRFLYKTTGACLAPWDSYLVLRGIKTLALRMERVTENAGLITAWLRRHPKVTQVRYPGQSGMVAFETDTSETAVHLLEHVRLITFAESLGGAESLVTYPLLQTHADVPPAVREALGITDRYLRLSVGIEYVQDLIDDLSAAFG